MTKQKNDTKIKSFPFSPDKLRGKQCSYPSAELQEAFSILYGISY